MLISPGPGDEQTLKCLYVSNEIFKTLQAFSTSQIELLMGKWCSSPSPFVQPVVKDRSLLKTLHPFTSEGLNHFWRFLPHITLSTTYSLSLGGLMLSKPLSLALTFNMTRPLQFQLAFITSYTMSPTPQTPEVHNLPSFPTMFLYFNFLLGKYYYQLSSHSIKHWCLPLFPVSYY